MLSRRQTWDRRSYFDGVEGTRWVREAAGRHYSYCDTRPWGRSGATTPGNLGEDQRRCRLPRRPQSQPVARPPLILVSASTDGGRLVVYMFATGPGYQKTPTRKTMLPYYGQLVQADAQAQVGCTLEHQPNSARPGSRVRRVRDVRGGATNPLWRQNGTGGDPT